MKSTSLYIIIFLLFLICYIPTNGQDGVNLEMYSVQPFHFGSLYPGQTGGKVSISENGARSATGTVILLNTYEPPKAGMIFLRTNPYSMVHLQYNSFHIYHSSGAKILLQPGPFSSGKNFIYNDSNGNGMYITYGGEMQVKKMSINPAGEYHGVFYITLISE
jgi:hypothetical protein